MHTCLAFGCAACASLNSSGLTVDILEPLQHAQLLYLWPCVVVLAYRRCPDLGVFFDTSQVAQLVSGSEVAMESVLQSSCYRCAGYSYELPSLLEGRKAIKLRKGLRPAQVRSFTTWWHTRSPIARLSYGRADRISASSLFVPLSMVPSAANSRSLVVQGAGVSEMTL